MYSLQCGQVKHLVDVALRQWLLSDLILNHRSLLQATIPQPLLDKARRRGCIRRAFAGVIEINLLDTIIAQVNLTKLTSCLFFKLRPQGP